MRAAAFDEFGEASNLRVIDAPEPALAPDGVLVRVAAAGVNPVDWKIREGRLARAFRHVFPVIPGFDAAGVVERVGAAVCGLAPGDEVYGYVRKHFVGEGAYAELVSAPEELWYAKPESLSMIEAAGVPTAALAAHQTILGVLAPAPGDVVVVAGAAGGVGGFAVQLAVLRGARVVGLASEGNHAYVRALGAEPLAYAGADLAERLAERCPEGIAMALDVIGGDEADVLVRALRPGGAIASIVDQTIATRAAEHGARGRYVFGRSVPSQLAEIAGLIDAGKLRVDIAETLPLDRAADAHRRSEEGHVRGKLVLEIAA
jgi:NADPH:quinone reductase-like Zn-dependent oxidoreductase